jgi:hypothetical protein
MGEKKAATKNCVIYKLLFLKVKDCDRDERCGWGVGGYEMIVENLFIEHLNETLDEITVSKVQANIVKLYLFH